MFGYCAIGKDSRAIPPASVMAIDSTEAKIGRSMKKREITGGPSSPSLGRRRWCYRFHLHARLHQLHAGDDDALIRLKTVLNDAHAVLLKRAQLDLVILDLVLLIDHVDELVAL